jgi:hypothetical protein
MLDELDVAMLKEMPFEAVCRNRLKEIHHSNPARPRFRAMYPEQSFSKAVMQCRYNQSDVGLVGNYMAKNYGGHFTHFALYATLREMGYSVLMIERPADAKAKLKVFKPVLFEKNPYKPFEMARNYPDLEAMKELNELCKVFVSGSDQMFNNNLYLGYNRFMCQGYVADNRYKMSYAGSFGHDHIWGSEEDRAEEERFLKRFNAFSVREDTGVDVCRNHFGIEATHVLDPVFLCPMRHYEKMVDFGKQYIPEKPYLFAYILDADEEKEKVLRYYADAHDLVIRAVSDAVKSKTKQNAGWSIETVQGVKAEGWLAHIAKSSFYITDSFHGMCFAVLFRKEFMVIVNKTRGETRFTSIARVLGLEDRLCYDFDELKERLKTVAPINYDAVYEKLEKERIRCKEYLKNHVEEGMKFYSNAEAVFKDDQKDKSFIPWFFKKVRGGIQCLKDNGLRYTVKHFFKKVRNRLK